MNKNIEKITKNACENKLIIFIFVVTGVFLGVFFTHFEFDLNVEIKNWVDTATYFNNVLSPCYLLISVYLIYKTWKSNEKEFKELRDQNKEFKEKDELKDLYQSTLPLLQSAIEQFKNNTGKIYVCSVNHLINKQNSIAVYDVDLGKMKEGCDRFITYQYDKSYENKCNIDLPIEFFQKCSLLKNNTMESDLMSRVEPYIERCQLDFFEFCKKRFGNFREDFKTCDHILYQSETINYAIDLADLLVKLTDAFPDDSNYKKQLHQYLYHTVGRYTWYTILTIVHQSYHSGPDIFRDHHDKMLEGVAKIIITQEHKALYNCLIPLKQNDYLRDKFRELRTQLGLPG